jgi:hypothetical protein
MRKPASLAISVLLATLLAALLMPMSAFADDDNEVSPPSNSKGSNKSLTEKQETEEKHKEIEGIYKNPGRISLPPVVIKPKITKQNISPVLPSQIVPGSITSETTPDSEITFSPTSPKVGAEIDISKAGANSKTPAETFIEAAYVGLGAMALGAIALAISAGTRSIRRK